MLKSIHEESIAASAGQLVRRIEKMLNSTHEESIEAGVSQLVSLCHGQSVAAGWYHNPTTGERINRNIPEMLALIHSEISEALEGFRKNLKDDHLVNRPMAEVELADAIIRICDLAGYCGFDLSGAILEKLEYNRNRADHKLENRGKEGGKKF